MPKNLELKARIRHSSRVEALASGLTSQKPLLLLQEDTYFAVRKGRLKLRSINGRSYELIHYERANRQGKRYSTYSVHPIKDPAKVKQLFKKLYGIKLVVRKKRKVFFHKNARIHIDQVKGLGSFIEFEVIVDRGSVRAERLMTKLKEYFNIRKDDCIGGSYVDLLIRKQLREKKNGY